MIMVDKKILREMSQDVLVIPFTEEMADKLDKFCRIHKMDLFEISSLIEMEVLQKLQ